MGRVYNSTDVPDSTIFLSQTPPNYDKKDYWLHITQQKVNADWDYRFNRAMVEQETEVGSNEFNPLEVVVQSVKTDTNNTTLSDDWRRLVFRDISYRCPYGLKFKFSYDFDLGQPDEKKSIWLASNRNAASATSSIIVVRCNGTLGSVYKDAQGITRSHYEPVIQTKDLQTVSLFHKETTSTAQAALMCIVQYNEYTKNYFINQRFIIGQRQVYRIKGISDFASNSTFQQDDLGTIILYLESVESSKYDNFETRIAYQQDATVQEVVDGHSDEYEIKFELPDIIPAELTQTPVVFKPVLYKNGEPTATAVDVECTLTGNTQDPSRYYKYEDLSDGKFALSKLKFYAGGELIVRCYLGADKSPTGAEIGISINLSLRGLT